jgi:small conductance mechanosensitive channel
VFLAFNAQLYAAAESQQTGAEAADKTGVQNMIHIPNSMNALWITTRDFLTTNGIQMSINIILAGLIFYIGRWIARILTDLMEKGFHSAHFDPTLGKFISNVAYFALLIFVVVAALGRLGVPTASFVAAVGAAGLAVGLALQGSLSNFAAGVLLIIFKPFRVSDYVEIAGIGGTVQEIQIFNTVLNSPDNVRIIVPNAQVTGANIKNYTANDKRRLDMVIGISYGDNIAKARQVIADVINSDGRVMRDPAPTVAVLGLGDSSVNIAVRPWIKPDDYWACHFDLHEKIKGALEANGITIPFPQRDIHIRTGQQKV